MVMGQSRDDRVMSLLDSFLEGREEKVSALQQQIAEGTYSVDAQKLAGSLLDTRY